MGQPRNEARIRPADGFAARNSVEMMRTTDQAQRFVERAFFALRFPAIRP